MSLLLTSCTVPIKNSEFCADAGRLGATCFHLLSDEQRDIPKAKWDDDRFGMVCEKPTVFADWKSIIETFCQNTGKCTYAQQEAVNNLMKRVDASTKKGSR